MEEGHVNIRAGEIAQSDDDIHRQGLSGHCGRRQHTVEGSGGEGTRALWGHTQQKRRGRCHASTRQGRRKDNNNRGTHHANAGLKDGSVTRALRHQ